MSNNYKFKNFSRQKFTSENDTVTENIESSDKVLTEKEIKALKENQLVLINALMNRNGERLVKGKSKGVSYNLHEIKSRAQLLKELKTVQTELDRHGEVVIPYESSSVTRKIIKGLVNSEESNKISNEVIASRENDSSYLGSEEINNESRTQIKISTSENGRTAENMGNPARVLTKQEIEALKLTQLNLISAIKNKNVGRPAKEKKKKKGIRAIDELYGDKSKVELLRELRVVHRDLKNHGEEIVPYEKPPVKKRARRNLVNNEESNEISNEAIESQENNSREVDNKSGTQIRISTSENGTITENMGNPAKVLTDREIRALKLTQLMLINDIKNINAKLQAMRKRRKSRKASNIGNLIKNVAELKKKLEIVQTHLKVYDENITEVHAQIPMKRGRPSRDPNVAKKKREEQPKNKSSNIQSDINIIQGENSQAIGRLNESIVSNDLNSIGENGRLVQDSQPNVEGHSDSSSHVSLQSNVDEVASESNTSIANNQDLSDSFEVIDYKEESQTPIEIYPEHPSRASLQLNEDEETNEANASATNSQNLSDSLEASNYKEEPRTPNVDTIEQAPIDSILRDQDSYRSSNISEDTPSLYSGDIDSKPTFLNKNDHGKSIAYGDSFSILSSEAENLHSEDSVNIKENLYCSDQSESDHSDEEELDWKQFPSANECNTRNILPNMFLEYQPAPQYKSFNYFGKRQFNSSFSASTQDDSITNNYRVIPKGPLYRITSPCKYMPLKHPKYYLDMILSKTYLNLWYMRSKNLVEFDIDASKTGEYYIEHMHNEVNSLLFKTGIGNCMQLIFKSWLVYVSGESQNQLWVISIHNQSKRFMLVETVQKILQIYVSNSDKDYVSVILRLEIGLIPFRLSYNEIKADSPRFIYPKPLQLHSHPLDVSFNLNNSSEFFVILKSGEFYKGEINLRSFDKLGEITIEESLPVKFTLDAEKNMLSQLDPEFYLKQASSNQGDQNGVDTNSDSDSSTGQEELDTNQSESEPEPEPDAEEHSSAPKLDSKDTKPNKPVPEPLSATRIRSITDTQLIIFTNYKLYKVRFTGAKTLINQVYLPYPTDYLLAIEVIENSDIVLLTRKYLMILSLHDPEIVQHVRAHLVPASPNSSLSISKISDQFNPQKHYLITVWSTFDSVPYSYIFSLCPEASLSQIPFKIPTPHCSSSFREYYKSINHKFYGFKVYSSYYNRQIETSQTQLDLPQLIGCAVRAYFQKYDYNLSIWWLTELGDIYQIDLKWTNGEIPSKLELYNSMEVASDPYEFDLISQNIQSELFGNESGFKLYDCVPLIKKLHYLNTQKVNITQELINNVEQLIPGMALEKIREYKTYNLNLIQFMEELVQAKVVYPHQLLNIISSVSEDHIWGNGLISKKSAKTWFKSPLSSNHRNLLEFDELNLDSSIENSRNVYARNIMLGILEKSTQVPISAQEIPRDSPPLETPKPDTDKPYKFKILHPKMQSPKLKDFVNRLGYRWGTRSMEDPGIVAADQRPIRNNAYLSQPLPSVSPVHSQRSIFAQTQPNSSSAHQSAYSQSHLPLPSSQQHAYTQSQLSFPSSQQPTSSQAPPYSIFSQPPTALSGFGSSTQPATSNLPFTTMSQPAPRTKPVQKKRTRGF